MGKPGNFMRVLLPIIAIIIAVVAALSFIKHQAANSPNAHVDGGAEQLAVGSQLADVSLTRLDKTTVKLSELKSKVVLVNFWASWCEACVEEMPSIVKLHDAYKDKGFEVIAINVDQEPEKIVPGISKKLGINFPVFIDVEQKMSDLFDVHAIPLTVILDHDRKILLMESGGKDWNSGDIRTSLEKWLAS